MNIQCISGKGIAEGEQNMRNISKLMYDKIALDELCIPVDKRKASYSGESMFLDLETVVKPIIQMYNVFDECGDEYQPDMSFVNEE